MTGSKEYIVWLRSLKPNDVVVKATHTLCDGTTHSFVTVKNVTHTGHVTIKEDEIGRFIAGVRNTAWDITETIKPVTDENVGLVLKTSRLKIINKTNFNKLNSDQIARIIQIIKE